MADHALWRGHLRLALVSCPVALYSARRDAGGMHFHYINPKTGHRVRMVTLDAESGDEIARRELVRGFEFKKDNYLLMDEEDFAAARIDSSTTLGITKFVEIGSIDPLFYDASYYMVPDGDSGADVYAVLRDAFEKTGRAALSRVVIGRRERAVAIMPMDRGLVVHTLHEARDINDSAHLFEAVPEGHADADMVALAVQLIDRQSGTYAAEDSEDRYEARLREVIDAKLRGEGVEPEAEPEDDRSNVVDLMAMLKKSLGGPKPAEPKARTKAATKKPATARSGGKKAGVVTAGRHKAS